MRRRDALALGLGAGLLATAGLRQAGAQQEQHGILKVGVLKFGTVNWELDVIKHYKLDEREGFTLDVQAFGGNDAADVALMGGAVDSIVEDWLWVSRQRADGVPVTWIPYSSNIGAVMVKADGPVASLADLKGRRVGVAGGPLDKGWLMLQAYGRDKAGIDLAGDAEPVYGAPPLVTEKFKSGELDAVWNYWHFCARLEAEGHRRLIEGAAVQEAFGVPASTPQLGYVFKEDAAGSSPALVQAFARASRAAKGIMKTSDAEWERLMPVTRAESPAVQEAFMRRYREGIVESWGEKERADAAELYRVLARLGGEKLVGKAPELAPGTFWPGVAF
jgi:NitT/TauT family transport system substrate-binding protein